MNIRGLYGLRKNNMDKCIYCCDGSQPDWLGRNMLKFCAYAKDVKILSEFFDNIMVDNKIPYEDADVCMENKWYPLINELKNSKNNNEKKNHGFSIPNNIDFIKNSLFCEYAYIINLDTGMLEFHKGYQRKICPENRYGIVEDFDGFYPCKLILEIPINDITEKKLDIFVVWMMLEKEIKEEDAIFFLKLKRKHLLSTAEALEIIVERKAALVDGVFKDRYEAESEQYFKESGNLQVFYQDESIFENINFENYSNEWYRPSSGVYVHFNAKE